MRVTLLLLIVAISAFPAWAAFKSSNDEVSLDDMWNPHPLPDDANLPMPCGLSLALRAIEIPSGALIRDKSFSMGIANSENPDRQIYERQFSGHIAAPFTLADLPAAWHRDMSDRQKTAAKNAWYFIGKYEITRQQWDAVMNALDDNGNENAAMCPPRGRSGGNLPAVDVSWFETQQFLNRYNEWLVRHHPDRLPAFKDTRNVGFLRLPTEEEWEYAARGGASVPPEWWADEDIFPFAEGKKFKDYAVINEDTQRSAPLGIGSRAPNPLGVHDTAGNAAEMVSDFFRMSIPDMANGQVVRRLHGAAGGLLAKGGSFRSDAHAAMPGAREEVPIFTKNGPGRQLDLGFRVALSGINIPNAQRLDALRSEINHADGRVDGQGELTGTTALEMLASLRAGSNGKLKESLDKIHEALNDQEKAREAEERKNLEQTFRSLLYQAETLRAFSFRYSSASGQLDKIRAMLAQPLSQENRAKARQLLASGEKDLQDYLQSLKMGANYYKASLGTIYQKPQAELERLFTLTKQEYGNNTIFDQHMRQNLDRLQEYMETAQKKGINSLDSRIILKGLLPEKQFRLLRL